MTAPAAATLARPRRHKRQLPLSAPLVTIAVLCYNNLDIIDDCLKAIKKLRYPAVECLLIDDCSTDATVEHVTETYPWVQVISKSVNSGIGTSRNLALEHASGSYILFHDSDARLFPDYLQSSVDLLERSPEIALVASKLLSLSDPSLLDQAGGGYSKFGFGIDRGKGQPASLFPDQEDVFFAGGAAQLVRMSLFDVIGTYDATTGTFGCEDVDISWRARLAGFRVVYNPKSVGQHGFHSTVKKLPSSKVLFHSQKAHARMLIKNFGRRNLIIYLPLVFLFSVGDIVLFPEGRLAKSRAWLWNIKYLRNTLTERTKVQRSRTVSDTAIEPYFEHDMKNIVRNKLRAFYGGKLPSKLGLKRGHLFSLALLPVLLLNLNFKNVSGLSVLWNIVVAFCLLILPGMLIQIILKIQKANLTTILYAAGLSILYLMALGLLVNSIVPLLGDHHPLTHGILLIAYDLTILPLIIFAVMKCPAHITMALPSVRLRSILAATAILLLPLLAICGATELNNGGSNLVSLLAIAAVAAGFIYYIRASNKQLVPLFLYAASVVMLYLFTFRSNYITGSDIVKEFRYFSTTFRQQSWHIDTTSNPYEACLSVTIFPTILANFFHINLQYLYKAIFPLLYGLIPLAVYQITQQLLHKKIAILATLFFISFSGFISVIPQHSREGIGLIFFGLLVLVIFDRLLSRTVKLSLAICFSCAMAVSHYSTAYLAVPLFGLAYLSSYVFRLLAVISKRQLLLRIADQLGSSRLYSGVLFVVISAFTFLWFTQATATSNNISTISKTLFVNLNSEYGETKYSFADQLNIFYKPDQNQTLSSFISSTTRSNDPATLYYSPSQTAGYAPFALAAKSVPTHVSAAVSTATNVFGSVLKIGLQLLMLIGLASLLRRIASTSKPALAPEYFFLCLAAVIIFGATFVLPLLSASYGQDRIYIQLLLFLSVCSVMGSQAFKWKFITWLIVPLYILYFLFYSGFIPYLAGGSIPDMSLANYGTEYDAIYTRKQEVVAAQWLEAHIEGHTPVLADVYGSAKIVASTKQLNPSYVGIIVPSTIPVASYVYVTETNLHEGLGAAYPKGSVLQYNFPNSFLNTQKDLIYSNGGAEIFR